MRSGSAPGAAMAIPMLMPMSARLSAGVSVSSIGSVTASLVLPSVAYFAGYPGAVVASACGVASLIVFRHRSNLVRVRFGTERRVGARI